MMTRAALLTLATLLAACQVAPAKADKGEASADADKDKEKEGEKKDDAPAIPGMAGLGNLGPLGAMMAQKLEEPGPYDALKASAGFAKDKPHWLSMRLEGQVAEMTEVSLSLGGPPTPTLELEPFLARLAKAAADPQVKGLVLRIDELALDWSSAEELRAGLVAFKGGGARQVACHADMAFNPVYHLLSACDRVGLPPHGMITISGAAATPVHIKGLLDRLGIVADFIHVGAFKGAAEPLTRTAPSKEMEETLGAIVDQYYATQKKGLTEGRGLDEGAAVAAIDRALFHAEAAKEAGLVDEIAVFEDFRAGALAGSEWTTLKLKEGEGAFDFSKLQVFLGLMPPKTPQVPHVALVYALGNIIDGDGEGILGARGQIAGHTLATAIRRMADDDKIAAIVLRVNSGGGSAIASEQIAQAIVAAKARKPVVVSMGRVAASGGYYISTNATKIFALPETLTGSIGVVGGKLALDKALGRIGINTYHIGRGKRSALWSMMTPWTADERASMLEMMEAAYKIFVTRVAEGRGKTYEQIHEIAQGRVWTGAAARERGLVDELGGLEAALAEARSLAKVDASVALEVYPPEPTLKDIVASLGPVSLPIGMRAALAEIEAHAGEKVAAAVEDTLGKVMLLRAEPVLTVAFEPAIFE